MFIFVLGLVFSRPVEKAPPPPPSVGPLALRVAYCMPFQTRAYPPPASTSENALEPLPYVVAVLFWQNNGVSMLAELVATAATEVRSAAMGALMMITTVDAGEQIILRRPRIYINRVCF